MNKADDSPDEKSNDGMISRAAALNILGLVLGQKKMLDSVLEHDRDFQSLSARDRSFVRMLVATVLRRKGQIDELIARAMNRGDIPKPDTLKWILYLGAAQILFMDVADHAAVDTSVSLTSQKDMDGRKGFVNAILRRLTVEGPAWLKSQDMASNVPDWLYQSWANSYGADAAQNIALASLQEAPLDITIKNKNDLDLWASLLSAEKLPTGSLRRQMTGNVTTLPGFDKGEWWVQDASSALPVSLFRDIAGKTVLDLCAAPGGKTMQLAAAGAKIVALDRSAARMAILSENLRRVNLQDHVQTIIEDGAAWQPKQTFTHILLDAPCTATGTLRRHPDLMHLKNEKDQAGLENIQERLLKNAASLLEIGGILIYCTCSLQNAEGEHQIEKFLVANRNFTRLPVTAEEIFHLDGAVNASGDVRIYPYQLNEYGGMDGFFMSRLQRLN